MRLPSLLTRLMMGVTDSSFAVNPLGVQREGLLQNGGGFGVTTAWDNRWFGETRIEKGKWVVEMKIPFKSIRYKKRHHAMGNKLCSK